jgi:hypothetical protein
MRKTTTLLALAAAAAASAAAATARWHVIASGRHYALWSTVDLTATAPKPAAIALRVISAPAQRTRVKWTMACETGSGLRRTSGIYVSTKTTLQKLRMPVRHPRSCQVSAHGRLSGGGTLTMRIYSRP